MDVKILTDEKDAIELQIGSVTIAEILRVYLNKEQAVKFAAWKRGHPDKPAILRVETSGKTPKKAIQESIEQINKDAEKLASEFKNA